MSVLNIGSRSTDWRAKSLSNFSPHSFALGGGNFVSVEGFIQGIKFPIENPNRQVAFASVGFKAKRIGREARPIIRLTKCVWWKGEKIEYRSQEYFDLIEQAIRAKFEQNPDAMKALLATAGMELTHDLGHPESQYTSLPRKVFCEILTRLREEKLKGGS